MHSQRTLCFVIAVILLTASFTTLIAVRAAAPKPVAVNQQKIEKFLKKHESLKLEPQEAARQVRESGRFLLATAGGNFELELTPNDLRAANYRAEEVTDGGKVHSVPMGDVHTYKGTVRGLPGAQARFTIEDEKIEGVIITTEERYYIEPLRNYAAASGKSDYVLYKGSDVNEDALGTCATTLDGKINAEFDRLSSSASYTPQAAGAVGNRQVDLATEADYEYVAYFGNSAAADTEILSIMNQVDGLFQTEFGVTFRITYQHTWATSADPYATTSSDGLLNQFTNYWNANISVPRDLAHMWTDNLMDGGNTVGIAWLGTVCRDPAHAYGISLRVVNGLKYSIAGHEIGHNFGATHPNQEAPPVPACDGTLMNSVVGMTFDFCGFSQAQMNGYVNSGCLAIVSTPATIQFSAANYPVSESANSALVTITRGGDISGAANIDYTASDGTASARSDYMAASGRLSFAPGESSKTFALLIVDDGYVEGNEIVNLSLSSPIGAALGNQGSATVTISDNDVVPSVTNPLDNAQFFVRQNYLDFLNREPDTSGLDFWSSQLAQCGTDSACLDAKRTNVSAAFFLSIEFQETGYLVYRSYKAAYGNLPGAPVPVRLSEFLPDTQQLGRGVVVGAPGWKQQLEDNKQAFAADFVARPAFFAAYPAWLAPEQFVDQLNANTGSSLTTQERDTLVNGLRNGTEVRASVLRKIAENSAFARQESNRAFVLIQYFGYLRRTPNDAPNTDFSGYNFWLGKLNQFNGDYVAAEMVKAFITSGEYRQRFGP
jgi:hypothetical protein